MKIRNILLAIVATGIVIGLMLVYAMWYLTLNIDTPEKLALKIDTILDKETPLEITEDDLVNKWPKEIAPYFEYEFLTNGEAKIPKVQFFEATDAFHCFHILGFTFVFDQSGSIFLNDKFRNNVSPKYHSIQSLVTLVHETAHIQGGEFTGMDAVVCEKNAQLATLEVLAAMANHGNKYARQALLDELRDISLGVVLHRAIKSSDMTGYRNLAARIYGQERDKGMRRWDQVGLSKLEDILMKYSVSVYDDFQDFQFVAKAEGDKSPRIFIMDDLQAFLDDLDWKKDNR